MEHELLAAATALFANALNVFLLGIQTYFVIQKMQRFAFVTSLCISSAYITALGQVFTGSGPSFLTIAGFALGGAIGIVISIRVQEPTRRLMDKFKKK